MDLLSATQMDIISFKSISIGDPLWLVGGVVNGRESG